MKIKNNLKNSWLAYLILLALILPGCSLSIGGLPSSPKKSLAASILVDAYITEVITNVQTKEITETPYYAKLTVIYKIEHYSTDGLIKKIEDSGYPNSKGLLHFSYFPNNLKEGDYVRLCVKTYLQQKTTLGLKEEYVCEEVSYDEVSSKYDEKLSRAVIQKEMNILRYSTTS